MKFVLSRLHQSHVQQETVVRGAPVGSPGFDPCKGDPSSDLAVGTEGFRAAGACIGASLGPVVLAQEDGCLVERLGDNLNAFLEGFFRARRASTP